jgi:hypothetical protein
MTPGHRPSANRSCLSPSEFDCIVTDGLGDETVRPHLRDVMRWAGRRGATEADRGSERGGVVYCWNGLPGAIALNLDEFADPTIKFGKIAYVAPSLVCHERAYGNRRHSLVKIGEIGFCNRFEVIQHFVYVSDIG